MDLAIVIVSYNTRELTGNCLASLYAAVERTTVTSGAPLSAKVWVVDNASDDASAAMVAERYPQAILLANPRNLGFAGGVNLGLEAIKALESPPSYVLLLNPDTLVAQDALSHMLAFLEEHPRVGVVGAQLAYGDGSFQHGAFRFPTLWMALFDFWTINHRLIHSRLNGRYPRRWYERGEPFAIDHPLGAAMMVRWQALQQVGHLDTDYFMYCEEIDWCMRAKGAGWGIYCVPQARIVHLEGQSAKQFRDKMFVALWRSRFRLAEKHYGPAYRVLLRGIVRMALRRDTRRARAAMLAGELGAEEAERRIAAYSTVMSM